jgi:hypothetical protein
MYCSFHFKQFFTKIHWFFFSLLYSIKLMEQYNIFSIGFDINAMILGNFFFFFQI